MELNRRTFLKAAGKLALGGALAGIGAGYYSTCVEVEWLAVERTLIPIKGLPAALDGFKIVLMSDIHLYPHTRVPYVQKVVDAANALKPDMVALAGDYVLETADAIDDLAPVLGRLDAKHGVFAVLGNHDLWTSAAAVRAGFEREGVPVLHNRGLELPVGAASLFVAGLDDAWSGHPDLGQALADCPGDVPVVLLAHEPDFADTYVKDGRVSLQLSGHTHGGQIRVPGVGALVLPRYGSKYDAGLFAVGGMWLYTTRGVGVISPAVRLNCRPELTELTLTVA